jgi:hypothetical protein
MIHVSIDSNEAMRPRADLIRKAISADPHFEEAPGETRFDLRFRYQETFRERCNGIENPDVVGFHRSREYPIGEPKVLHVEIKDFGQNNGSDYLSSILSGHLWGQCQAAREIGEPFVIAVLGDDADISSAIRKAAGHGQKSKHGSFDLTKFKQYADMVDGFEANAIGCGIRVWHLGYNQYPRLLLRARKILQGGDLSGFSPSPPEDERQKVGLSILAGKGIGPVKAGAILEHFSIWLVPDDVDGYLTDCEGIGPKLAEKIAQNIKVGMGAVVRPKQKKVLV